MVILCKRGEMLPDLKEIFNASENTTFKTSPLDARDIPLSEELKAKLKRLPSGAGIGGVPPEGWVNIGEHVISLILSSGFISNVVASAVWDGFKKTFSLLKRDQRDSNDKMAIVTDEYDNSKYRKTIYFVLYAYQSEDEAAKAIQAIPEIRKKTLELLDIADFGGDVIRFTYSGRWRAN